MLKSATKAGLAAAILLLAVAEANAMLIIVPKTLSFEAAMVSAPMRFEHIGLERPAYETHYAAA